MMSSQEPTAVQPPPSAMPAPARIARSAHGFERVLARKSKSFALAAKLLPRSLRGDIAVLYAYCRYVDDAVDLEHRAGQRVAVERLRSELHSVYAGNAQPAPLLAAFQDLVRRRQIPRSYAEELLNGMSMDAAGFHYRDPQQLAVYCYRVAGTVGLMLCHVLGVRDRRALRHAAHLGMAMQLTNICRDVAEDHARGRLYLPRLWLSAAAARALENRASTGLSADAARALRPAIRTLLGWADAYYRSADRGLWYLTFRTAFAIRAARLIYSAIGDRLRARGCDVLAGRAVVPLAHKLVLVLVAAVLAACELPRRLRTPFEPARALEPEAMEDVLSV
jgi:phytoene synthase